MEGEAAWDRGHLKEEGAGGLAFWVSVCPRGFWRLPFLGPGLGADSITESWGKRRLGFGTSWSRGRQE